jgi:hypothetical protein
MHAEPSLLRGRGAVFLNRDVLAQAVTGLRRSVEFLRGEVET